MLKGKTFALLVLVCATACVTAGPPVTPTPSLDPHHGPRRFYTGKTYGSEAVFNPLTHILNEGFDVLSARNADRRIFERPYGVDAGNVLRSVARAPESLREYGWDNVLKAELLPTSLSRSRTSGK